MLRNVFRMRRWMILCSVILLAGCGEAADKLAEAIGSMTFTGTVKRVGSGEPIEGATVRFIELLDLDAVTELMEVTQVPDGKGGQRKLLRLKLDKVHAHPAKLEVQTDASGKFEAKPSTSAYLVYTFGPGGAPGTTGNAYSPHFWGINPETGELDLTHLIGSNGKLDQSNDAIELAGGPVPPPPGEAPVDPAPPQPGPTPDSEPEPTENDPDRPEDFTPPVADTGFWTKINMEYDGGKLGTDTSVFEVDVANPASGERYLTVVAELATAQTEAVYLVLQSGFDSTTTPGCESVEASAKTHIYPVQPNGTHVEYKLVSPGPFYKLFFAKAATKADGAAVVADAATRTLTVGRRSCEDAVPSRPFLATLSWDRDSDVDLHVYKYDAAKLAAGDYNNAVVDQASYCRPTGTSLSLDVDNRAGFGPENTGDAQTEANPDAYCYAVLVNLYAWADASQPVRASVDVTYLSKEGGKSKVKKYAWSDILNQHQQWKTVGVFGSAEICSSFATNANLTR